MTMSKLLR